MSKVITFYGNYNETDLENVWNSSKTRVPGNVNFTWPGTSEADFTGSGGDWINKKGIAAHGDDVEKQQARDAKDLFEKCVGVIADSANHQTTDRAKLISTGLPLQKGHVGTVGDMDQPVILDVTTVKGVTGAARVTISTSEKHCTGTHIRLKNLTTNTTVELWVKEEHVLPLSGLSAGNQYQVEVAYAGASTTKVWSDPAEFWAQ